MNEWPLAYHMTFGTYGMRLHGDARGTVDRQRNKPGEPIVGQNQSWVAFEKVRLNHPPVSLTLSHQLKIESLMPSICERGDWEHWITAAESDHVHTLITVTGHADTKVVRKLIKRWLGQALSEQYREIKDRQPWWAEGGSIKWVWDQGYFDRVYDYIRRQRKTQD